MQHAAIALVTSNQLEAAGTASASVIALILLGLTVADRRRQGQDLRRAQAARVRLSKVTYQNELGPDDPWNDIESFVEVVNRSKDVISELRVRIATTVQTEDGATSSCGAKEYTHPRLDPGESHKFLHFDRVSTGFGWDSGTASLRFTDASGNRWERDSRHLLIDYGRAGQPVRRPGVVVTVIRALKERREQRTPD
jgi:hypothetical protein